MGRSAWEDWWRGAVLVAGSGALAACAGDAVTGPEAAFDPRAAAAVVQELAAAEGANLASGHARLIADVLETLTEQELSAAIAGRGQRAAAGPAGALAWRAWSRPPSALAPAPGAGASGPLPASAMGKTFAIASVAEARYQIDSSRADAPVDGARFVLYELDAATGRPLAPARVAGRLDLLDATSSEPGLTLTATGEDERAIAELSLQGSYEETADGFTSSFSSLGMLDRAGRTDFAVEESIEVTDGLGRAMFRISREIARPGRGVRARVDLEGELREGGPPGATTLRLAIADRSHTASVAVVDDGVSVVGSMTVDGRTWVRISGDPHDPRFTGADGESLSGAGLRGARELWHAIDVALAFGGELLGPLSELLE